MLLVKAKFLQASGTLNHTMTFEINADSLKDFYLEVPADMTNYLHQLTLDNALAVAEIPGLDFVGVVMLTNVLASKHTKNSTQKYVGTILQVLTSTQSEAILKRLVEENLQSSHKED